MIIGRFDAALIEMQQARQLLPQSAEIRHNLKKYTPPGTICPERRAELKEAVRLDPAYMEARDALRELEEITAEFERARPESRPGGPSRRVPTRAKIGVIAESIVSTVE